MNITKLELLNFRNYKKINFDNFSNLNIIIGKNGVGKTSIVEAIYLGSLAKSFKTNNIFYWPEDYQLPVTGKIEKTYVDTHKL